MSYTTFLEYQKILAAKSLKFSIINKNNYQTRWDFGILKAASKEILYF